jgi:PKD repeat protein
MSNSYARGAVDGSTRVGGLVGHHSGGPLHATYATGLVAKSDGGGLVGRMAADHPVVDSYWDRETTTRLGSSGGGTRLDTARMTGDAVREHMPGLDVPDDWHLTDSYPVLAWEAADPFLAVDVTGATTPVSAGDTLRMNGTVYNFGGVPGNGTVTLRDTHFRGQVQDDADVTLPAGESTPVQLAWRTRPGDAGIGTVTVATGDDADTVDVRVVDGPVAEASLVNVTLAAAPNGFTEYYIVVRIPGQTVQAVRPVLVTEASGNPGFQVWDGGVGTDTVGAFGGGFPALDPFNDTRTLFSVNVTGDVLASDVELTVESLRGPRGDMNESLVGLDVTRVVVVPPSPFPGPVPGSGGQGPPTDSDGDGRYDDVDGSGATDFDDVIALAFVDRAALTPGQAAALDFDGNGAFEFGDVIELAFGL